MNPFTFIKMKVKDLVFWVRRKIQGDVRPTAVKQTKPRKPRKKKESK